MTYNCKRKNNLTGDRNIVVVVSHLPLHLISLTVDYQIAAIQTDEKGGKRPFHITSSVKMHRKYFAYKIKMTICFHNQNT